MYEINLLPLKIQRQRMMKALTMRLVVTQAFIVVLLVGAMMTLRAYDRHVWQTYQGTLEKVQSLPDEPSRLVEKLHQLDRVQQDVDEFFYAHFPFVMQTQWFSLIHDATPAMSTLTWVAFAGGQFTIHAEAATLEVAQHHKLLLSEHFEHVSLGKIYRDENGSYAYEIFINT